MKILHKKHVYRDGDYSICHDEKNTKFSIRIFSGIKTDSNSRTSYRKMNVLHQLKEKDNLFTYIDYCFIIILLTEKE